MAKGGGSSRGRRDAAPRRAVKPRPQGAKSTPRKPAPTPPAPAPAPAPIEASGPFVLGMIPGATPGKWIDTWRERTPDVPIELEPIAVSEQRERVLDGTLDAALVRLPIDASGLHVIPLYDEVAVVVMSAESSLTVADELELADLAGEVVIVPLDDVYALTVPDAVAPRFDPPVDTAEAIATVAAGVGVVIVPMSLARLHHRKDAAHRILRGGPTSTVALAWPADRTTPGVEALVGIVRGRTANSSRG